jgi:hypothetical protein
MKIYINKNKIIGTKIKMCDKKKAIVKNMEMQLEFILLNIKNKKIKN